MAWYKNFDFFSYKSSAAFDKFFSPGDTIEHSGIYRCKTCGFEAVSTQDKKAPPQHIHVARAGSSSGHKVEWQLIAAAKHKDDTV